jgi:hypothetical protein
MVALALAVVARLCRRRLTWRAMVFDLRGRTLRYAQTDLHDTALLVDLRTDNALRHPSAWPGSSDRGADARVARAPHATAPPSLARRYGGLARAVQPHGQGMALAEPLPAASHPRAGVGLCVVPVLLMDAAGPLLCDELNDEPLSIEQGAP